MDYEETIHVTIPGSPEDPRSPRVVPPGIVIHYVPELHPDDLAVVQGLSVTSVSRTLIDCAQDAEVGELRQMFAAARAKGLLDREAMEASLARVEWRPSLPLVWQMIDEFCD